MGIYALSSPVCHQDMLQLQSPARLPIVHDLAEALGATIVFFFNHFLLNKSGPDLPSYRPLMLEDPMVTKNRLVKVMVDHCLAGEFGGSYFRAAREPECVALGIFLTPRGCAIE